MIHLLILALYKLFVCLFVCLPSFLTFFLPYILLSLYFLSYLFVSSLVYFLTYPSPSSRIGLLRFQAAGRRMRYNLALFFGLFYVVVYFVMDACLLLLRLT